MTATDTTAHLALAAAERLLDADTVTGRISEQSRGSLSGLAGTALLHARLSVVDPRFEAAAIEHWRLATVCARRGGRGSGTFSGPGAVAASLIIGTAHLPDPQRWHDQCAAAARWLSAHAVAVADRHRDRRRSGIPAAASWATYDAIGGLAGTGRVLMVAVERGHHYARAGLDAALHTLTDMISTRIGERPGWWLPADAHPAATAVHPTGAAATGTAHGIAGPLALLALAHTAGYRVPGQDQAIRTAADWLLRWREPATDTWPPHITGCELDHGTATPVPGRRDAWCYGTPGIAAALEHAAPALGDEYLDAADHAMRTLAARDPRSWDVDGPTLCHGYAGILQASRGHPDLAMLAAAHIIEGCDPRHRYLIGHGDQNTACDDPGLLTGAAGAALALADHAKLPAYAPAGHWDAVLLLS
jgi:hypothetical protein